MEAIKLRKAPKRNRKKVSIIVDEGDIANLSTADHLVK